MTKLKFETVAIDELHAYENNAKLHPEEQIEQIIRSIEEFGFNDPIAVDEKGMVVEGHGRLIALKQMGETHVPIIRLNHLTEEQKKAYILVHNQLTLNTGFDEELLRVELESIIDIDMGDFGFDLDLVDIEEKNADEYEDNFEPELPDEPSAKRGDIYQLGSHRLMCGDSTNMEDVQLLLNGESIDLLHTDPPYNVAFSGRSGKFDVIKNDDLPEREFERFIERVVKVIKKLEIPNHYIWCNWKFYGILQRKLAFKSCIVWAKNVFGLGKGYRHQHEFCLFNGTIDEEIKNESDLWEVAKDSNYVHPTQKPIGLCARALRNHKSAKNVLDLFGGSGSTLMACEQMERRSFLMELDERYVDVIIRRWEEFTGEKAVLIHSCDERIEQMTDVMDHG